MTIGNEQSQTVYQLSEPPRSFVRMLRQLPGQYWRVLTRPSPETFTAESGKANWGIIWLQLLVMAIFSGSLAVLSGNFIPPTLTPVQLSELSNLVDPQAVQKVLNASSTIQLGLAFQVTFLAQFLGFFLLMGSLHLVSVKFMGSSGSFKTLCSNMLLATLPLMLVTGSLGTSPYLTVLAIAGSLYMLVLQTMAVVATYRLSAWRAIGALLLSILVMVAVIVTVAVFFSSVIVLGVIQVL